MHDWVHTLFALYFVEEMLVQGTLLNPYMCNPDFRLNRTDWKVPVPSYTYNFYTHNPDFA